MSGAGPPREVVRRKGTGWAELVDGYAPALGPAPAERGGENGGKQSDRPSGSSSGSTFRPPRCMYSTILLVVGNKSPAREVGMTAECVNRWDTFLIASNARPGNCCVGSWSENDGPRGQSWDCDGPNVDSVGSPPTKLGCSYCFITAAAARDAVAITVKFLPHATVSVRRKPPMNPQRGRGKRQSTNDKQTP